jgi:hypothetical protein
MGADVEQEVWQNKLTEEYWIVEVDRNTRQRVRDAGPLSIERIDEIRWGRQPIPWNPQKTRLDKESMEVFRASQVGSALAALFPDDWIEGLDY